MPSLHGMRALTKGSGETSFLQMLTGRFRTPGISLHKLARFQTFWMRMSVPKPHYFF
jgi:hypothetical protein